MTQGENEEYDRKIKKTKKIIIYVIIPILLLSTILILFYDTNLDLSEISTIKEKPSYIEVLEMVPDIHCYNVNWFGVHGFQITYNESIDEIVGILQSYDMDFDYNKFFQEQDVIDYLVLECSHIDNRMQAPDHFDPMIGVPALDKCLQARQGFVDSEEFCLQFK